MGTEFGLILRIHTTFFSSQPQGRLASRSSYVLSAAMRMQRGCKLAVVTPRARSVCGGCPCAEAVSNLGPSVATVVGGVWQDTPPTVGGGVGVPSETSPPRPSVAEASTLQRQQLLCFASSILRLGEGIKCPRPTWEPCRRRPASRMGEGACALPLCSKSAEIAPMCGRRRMVL